MDIKLIPRNLNNPTYEVSDVDIPYRFDNVVHDTYDYTVSAPGYETATGTVIVDGHEFVEVELMSNETGPTITWVPRSRTRTKAYGTTTQENSNLLPSQGYTIPGTNGVETQTFELQYQDGQPTSIERNHSAWVETTAPVNAIVVIGTKVEDTEFTSILTQPNVEAMYGTNTYVDGVRTTGDAVPINGEIFEMRQWDPPAARLNIYDGNLQANTQYTLAMELENIGSAIATAKFLIGMSFFGGKHYFNGDEVTITPSAGEYNFKPHMPNSGKVTYLFQFTTEPDTPNGDYFQIAVDNANDDIMLRVSNLGLYAGHINPFGA